MGFMAPTIAKAETVSREQLLEFVSPRHHHTLITRKRDDSLQVSPVSAGVDSEGRIVIATYPERAKVHNIRRTPAVTVLVHSDDWNGDYVQVDGPKGRVCIKGWGHYHETYRKGDDGRWRISSKRNTRLRVDEVPWTLPEA